jgi:predicted RNase H-like nuclease (RuvC/YqgF family)
MYYRDMNYDEIIVPSVTGALGAFVTWVFGRKRENVEVQNSEIKNVADVVALWKDMASELKQEVSDLKVKVEQLSTEIHTLRSENISLRLQLGLSNEDN